MEKIIENQILRYKAWVVLCLGILGFVILIH